MKKNLLYGIAAILAFIALCQAVPLLNYSSTLFVVMALIIIFASATIIVYSVSKLIKNLI